MSNISLPRAQWSKTTLHPLAHIPQPPEELYYEGQLPPADITLLTVVGSRQYTTYGKQVVTDLIEGLRSYPVGIVSGLALGIDGLAHEAALQTGLYTLAVPGSGLDRSVLYPRRHRGLADRIITAGGGLLSEFPPLSKAARWSFPQRNRVMAGLARATILIEATERSGTLITARLAVEYNRELFVVPGNIYAPGSAGVHQFFKLGATPITTSTDIIQALDLKPIKTELHKPTQPDSTTQQILDALAIPQDIDAIAQALGVSSAQLSSTLMQLELDGLIRQENGLYSRRI